MVSMDIPMPKVKEAKLSVPLSSKTVDMTDLYGGPYFEERTDVTFEFVLYDKSFERWSEVYSRLSNRINGEEVQVILDSDPSYYYVMRLYVNSVKSKKALSKIVLKGTAEPYKYSVASSLDDWLWDTFNFENGIITNYYDIQINSFKRITFPAGRMAVSPQFFVEDGDAVFTRSDVEKYYPLKEGSNYYPQFKVNGDEPVEIEIYATIPTLLHIIYRGGSL